MEDLRRHKRFEVDTPAIITFMGSEDPQVDSRVAEISEGGLTLLVPAELTPGEMVRVEIKNHYDFLFWKSRFESLPP